MSGGGESQQADKILDALTQPGLARSGRLLEVSHVAHRLSVSQEQVRRYIRAGLLKAVRLPMNGPQRVHEHALEEFINNLTPQQPTTTCNKAHRAA